MSGYVDLQYLRFGLQALPGPMSTHKSTQVAAGVDHAEIHQADHWGGPKLIMAIKKEPTCERSRRTI